MKFTYIIATRGRSDDVKKSIEATLPHMKRDDSVMLVCVDNDDDKTIAMLSEMPPNPKLRVSVKEREDSRGEKYGRALTLAPADLYLVGHDCVPITTPGFDAIMLEAADDFKDGIGVVCTPMANGAFPSLQAMTAKFIEKMKWGPGAIYNPAYPFWFIDHEVDDIGRMIGRNRFVDIAVDTGSRRPGNTLRLRDLTFWMAYFDICTLERRRIAHAMIDGDDYFAPLWLKRIIKSQHPMVEARSLILHQSLRASAWQIEQQRGERGPPDEGYVRLKVKAEARCAGLMADLKAFQQQLEKDAA